MNPNQNAYRHHDSLIEKCITIVMPEQRWMWQLTTRTSVLVAPWKVKKFLLLFLQAKAIHHLYWTVSGDVIVSQVEPTTFVKKSSALYNGVKKQEKLSHQHETFETCRLLDDCSGSAIYTCDINTSWRRWWLFGNRHQSQPPSSWRPMWRNPRQNTGKTKSNWSSEETIRN